jgi:flagellar capping protein FliD
VKGTIGGEAAVGIGQVLSGRVDNKNTAGLVVRVTSDQTGAIGAVRVAHGAADKIKTLVTHFSTGNTSPVMSAQQTINSQVDDIEKQVKEMKDQTQKYTDTLTAQFNDMEKRMSTLNAQKKALNTELTAAAGGQEKDKS